MSTESDCWKVIEVGIQAAGVVMTAIAAFGGAFFAYRFSKYQSAIEAYDKDVNLLNALIAVCAIQEQTCDRKYKDMQHEDERMSKAISQYTKEPSSHRIYYIMASPFHSQREAFLRINSAMLGGRIHPQIYEHLCFVDLHLLNVEQHFEELMRFAKANKEVTDIGGADVYQRLNAVVTDAMNKAFKEVVNLKNLCFAGRKEITPPSIFGFTW